LSAAELIKRVAGALWRRLQGAATLQKLSFFVAGAHFKPATLQNFGDSAG
jgi:hypothetical protein